MHFLNCVDCRKHRVILTTCYAAGLRISEAVRLKAAAIDSARMVVHVEQGKGRKGTRTGGDSSSGSYSRSFSTE